MPHLERAISSLSGLEHEGHLPYSYKRVLLGMAGAKPNTPLPYFVVGWCLSSNFVFLTLQYMAGAKPSTPWRSVGS